jgi:uncharacterized Zn-binding protein involved in type VI secretion
MRYLVYLIRLTFQLCLTRLLRGACMFKAMVRHGDPTTTGGLVNARSSTMFDDGKRIALHGDEATCGSCEGAFKIFGTSLYRGAVQC